MPAERGDVPFAPGATKQNANAATLYRKMAHFSAPRFHDDRCSLDTTSVSDAAALQALHFRPATAAPAPVLPRR